uniref:Uncharacterized protein n=1 Tax=Glossina pallidipes TaxID=7398 RepID=A0A1B0AH11_GLOPL
MVEIKDLQIRPEVCRNPLIIIHMKSMLLYGFIVSTEQKHKRFSLRRGAVFTISFVISCALIVLKGEAEPILLFQLFPFGEVYDNFLVGYLGACYALFLGITTIPCWHTFITCLMKYIVIKFQIINKRLEQMDISKLSPKFSLQPDMIDNLNEKDLNYWRLKMCEFCVQEQIKIK